MYRSRARTRGSDIQFLNTSSPSAPQISFPPSPGTRMSALCATSVFLSSKTRLAPRINRANAAKAARAPKRVRVVVRASDEEDEGTVSHPPSACASETDIFHGENQTGSQCALFPEKRVIAITSADACDRPDRTSARQTSDNLPLSGPPHYRIFVTQRKKRPWLKVRASPPPAFVRFREERHSR